MSFSNTHANFLVNHENGTFEEAIYLINLAKQKVKEQFKEKLSLIFIDIEEEISLKFIKVKH
jgi:UDP-N-acetylmuramate dehydrogenase